MSNKPDSKSDYQFALNVYRRQSNGDGETKAVNAMLEYCNELRSEVQRLENYICALRNSALYRVVFVSDDLQRGGGGGSGAERRNLAYSKDTQKQLWSDRFAHEHRGSFIERGPQNRRQAPRPADNSLALGGGGCGMPPHPSPSPLGGGPQRRGRGGVKAGGVFNLANGGNGGSAGGVVRNRCPECGSEFAIVQDQNKCEVCGLESAKHDLISDDDDYTWVV